MDGVDNANRNFYCSDCTYGRNHDHARHPIAVVGTQRLFANQHHTRRPTLYRVDHLRFYQFDLAACHRHHTIDRRGDLCRVDDSGSTVGIRNIDKETGKNRNLPIYLSTDSPL